MIAKLVTWGEDRIAAIERQQEALDRYHIRGVLHNISFLNALMAHPRFREGRLSTNFIAEEYPEGFHPADVPREDPARAILVAALVHRKYMDRAAAISGQMPGHERQVHDDWVVVVKHERHHLHVRPQGLGYRIEYDARHFEVSTKWRIGQPIFEAVIDGVPFAFQVERAGIKYRLFHRGAEIDALVLAPHAAPLFALMPEKAPPDLSRFLLSPMPGLLIKVSVSEGQEIKAGEELAVIEAMKMENVLRAAADGVVGKVLAEVGASLKVDQAIIEFVG